MQGLTKAGGKHLPFSVSTWVSWNGKAAVYGKKADAQTAFAPLAV